jgi:hypothetical protein
MATFKITPSKLRVNTPQTPNISSGAIPINLALKLGSDISQAGRVFDQIKQDQKAIENENRFYEIIGPKQKEIDATFNAASKMSELEPAEKLLNEVYDIDVSKENKNVQKLVNTYINKTRLKNQSDLYKSVMARSAEKAQLNDLTFLNRNLIERTSESDGTRLTAEKDFVDFFNQVSLDSRYNPESKQKLKDEYEFLKKEILIKSNIKRRPFEVLLNQDEILKNFGPQKGELYLKMAQDKFISDVNQEVLENDKQINERIFNQSITFAEYANRINDGLGDLNLGMPSIDNIHDSLDRGDINSAQYDALVELISNPEKISDERLINVIDNQILIAEEVNEFDDIKNIANSSADILKNTNIKDITVLNKLIDQLKTDPSKTDKYKQFYKQLVINMGDLGGLADTLFGSGGPTPYDKMETADAVARFKNYVVNGDDPEAAYFKVLGTITKEKIPDIYSPNLQPLNLDIPDMAVAIQKNPDGFFDDQGNKLAQKLRNKEINKDQFIEDVARLDLLKDVYDTRLRVFDNNIELAVQKKEKASNNLGSIFQDILNNRGAN